MTDMPLVLLRSPSATVWELDLDSAAHGLHARILSAQERARRDAYRFAADATRFVNGRLWLRRVLADHGDLAPGAIKIVDRQGHQPEVTLGGRPFETAWSLSRTGAHGALAIGAGRLGIDIERLEDVPEREAVAAQHFSAQEQAALSALPAPIQLEAFHRVWTSKEALIKATGEGLTADLSAFSVEVDPRRPPAVLEGGDPYGAADWRLTALHWPGGPVGVLAESV